jgi:hypothetical protein
VYLNNGSFRLPVQYGAIGSPELHMSESLANTLPQVHQAFLSVRLFNPNLQQKFNAAPPRTREVDNSTTVASRSVASVLFNAMPFSTAKLPMLHLSKVIQNEITSGAMLDPGEKRVVVRQFAEWISAAFPHHQQKILLINPQHIVGFDFKQGVCAALDMLYNMPEPYRRCCSLRGKNDMYDGQNVFFKAHFQYLPGATDLER